MAIGFKACSVNGCNGNAHWTNHGAMGMCQKHYVRFSRNGDPLKGRTSPGTLERYLRDVVLKYEGDECHIWPHSRNRRGYAVMKYEGRQHFVSRIVCRLVNGEPAEEQTMAAHSCGNGHMGCVSQKHIRWATPIENSADRVEHGRAPRGDRHVLSKLSEDDVRTIRSLRGVRRQDEIASLFGIAQTSVSQIQLRKAWAWLD